MSFLYFSEREGMCRNSNLSWKKLQTTINEDLAPCAALISSYWLPLKGIKKSMTIKSTAINYCIGGISCPPLSIINNTRLLMWKYIEPLVPGCGSFHSAFLHLVSWQWLAVAVEIFNQKSVSWSCQPSARLLEDALWTGRDSCCQGGWCNLVCTKFVRSSLRKGAVNTPDHSEIILNVKWG